MNTPTKGARIRFREFGWAGIFLAVLATLLFPAILVSAAANHTISIIEQAGMILAATLIIQLLRKEPLSAVTGSVEARRLVEFAYGGLAGAALMVIPAALLWSVGLVRFDTAGTQTNALYYAVALMFGVAVTEELLFRGFLFQRLGEAFGEWPAQLLIATLFVLTHLNNPGMAGATKVWASVNIFLASIMFGMAYLRTRSLAMPIGLHFVANVTQGILLGFGVSGGSQPRILVPIFGERQAWLSGGSFGLEASPLGLAAVICVIILISRKRPRMA